MERVRTTERWKWRRDGGDRPEGGGALSLLASLPGGVSRMVCNSMELKHTYTQPPNMPWLWVTMEAWDEEHFIFWNGPPRRTTVTYNATEGHVGVSGPCCCPKPLKPDTHVDVCSLCHWLMPWWLAALGAMRMWVTWVNHLKPHWGLWPMQPLRAMGGSVVLIQLRAVLISITCVTTKAHVDWMSVG